MHGADGWRDVLEPTVSQYDRTGVRQHFRDDAAFASLDVCEYLEERRVIYALPQVLFPHPIGLGDDDA